MFLGSTVAASSFCGSNADCQVADVDGNGTDDLVSVDTTSGALSVVLTHASAGLTLDPPFEAPAPWLSLRVPSPANLGELAWRIGLWLASVNVVLMAVAVASASPRATRTLHLVIALFAFITYYNLLNLGQSWIASGRVGFLSFLVGLHGGALLLALVWLAVRHFQWHPAHLLRRRTP
jgi:lipopolysaccharide export system permease protein